MTRPSMPLETIVRRPIDALMSRAGPVPIAERDWPLGRIAQKMAEGRSSCLVVCDGRTPIGVISDADVTRCVADGFAGPSSPRTAAEIMWPPLSVPRDATIAEAVGLVGGGEAQRLVVVNPDGSVAGLLTESDLLRAELERSRHRLDTLALDDAMLEIGNVRAMERELFVQDRLADRHGRTYAVALFDVDNMADFNERYGRAAGDEWLRAAVEALRATKRGSDRLYRCGGASVLVLLPETDRSGALRAAHRMRKVVEDCGVTHEGRSNGRATVSGGAASNDNTDGWEQVVDRAERGVALAKGDGGNAVRAADGQVGCAA